MAGVTFYGRRSGSTVVPVNEAGEEAIHEISEAVTLRVTLVRERQPETSNLYHLLCHRIAKVLQAMGRDDATRESVSDAIKIAVGHTRTIRTPKKLARAYGPVMRVPKSISFAAMDETQFRAFMARVTDFLWSDLLAKMPAGPERDGIAELLDYQARKAHVLERDQGVRR